MSKPIVPACPCGGRVVAVQVWEEFYAVVLMDDDGCMEFGEKVGDKIIDHGDRMYCEKCGRNLNASDLVEHNGGTCTADEEKPFPCPHDGECSKMGEAKSREECIFYSQNNNGGGGA